MGVVVPEVVCREQHFPFPHTEFSLTLPYPLANEGCFNPDYTTCWVGGNSFSVASQYLCNNLSRLLISVFSQGLVISFSCLQSLQSLQRCKFI